MNEMISVIVPVYKVEEYLPKCIESVLNQNYSNFELILVDDGSPDSCGAICDAYAEKDEHIKVIHKENGGLSDARNAGMSVASGEYFSFIDSDDWVEADYLGTLFRLLRDNDADLSAIPLCKINEEGKEIGPTHTGNVTLMDDSTAMKTMFSRKGLPWCAQAKLYKRSLFDGITFPVGLLMEDKATIPKVFAKCEKIVYADLPLYKYLLRSGSIMRSQFSVKRLQTFAIQEELNSFIEQNYPDAVAITHAYTVRVAVSMLCRMCASGYNNMERSEQLFNYLVKYRKEFFQTKIIDKRYKIVGCVILWLRRFCGQRIYKNFLYKKLCSVVEAVFAAQ